MEVLDGDVVAVPEVDHGIFELTVVKLSLPWSEGKVADGGVVSLAPHDGAVFTRRDGKTHVTSDECSAYGGQVGEGCLKVREALFGAYCTAAKVGDGAVDFLSSCVPPVVCKGADANAVHVMYEQFPPCDGIEVARIVACTIGVFL